MDLLKNFSEKLIELGKKHKNLCVFNSDFQRFTGCDEFAETFSERFFNMGLMEGNLVACAAGFAIRGKMPFVVGMVPFITGRAFEQIRNTICNSNLNVKIVGMGCGISFAQEGHVWQSFEDIALMRTLPNMKIISPCDGNELKAALETVAGEYGPCYLRIPAGERQKIFDEDLKFKFGKSEIVKEGRDVCIFAIGSMVERALEVAYDFLEKGVSVKVVNISSVKPLDEKMVRNASEGIKLCVSMEDQNILCGLGVMISGLLGGGAEVLQIGIDDRFGESGKREEIERKFGLDVASIVDRIKNFF